MKKINILGHSFELENNAANYLQSYLQKLDKFGEQNGENFETIDDIKYSLIEKLYSKSQPISETDVFQITDQLGDPENIFETKNTENNYIKNELASNRPLIWGVAYWISKSLKLNILVVRILFLVLPFILGILGVIFGSGSMVFFSSISTWLYIILALFVPYRSKNQKSPVFSFLEIILWILRLILAFGMAIIIGSIVVAGIGILLSKLMIVDNRSAALLFPSWFFVLTFVGTACLMIFSLDFLLRFFNKRLFSPIKTFSLLAISFLSFVLVGATLAKYAIQGTKNQIQIAGESQDLGNINDEKITISIPQNFSPFTQPDISFEATTGENILVEKNYNITDFGSSKNIGDNLEDIAVSKTGNRLIVGQDGYIGFSKPVPLNFLQVKLKFLVPKNKIITIQDNIVSNNNPFNRRFRNYGIECNTNEFRFDNYEKKFICSDRIGLNQTYNKVLQDFKFSDQNSNFWPIEGNQNYSFYGTTQNGYYIAGKIKGEKYYDMVVVKANGENNFDYSSLLSLKSKLKLDYNMSGEILFSNLGSQKFGFEGKSFSGQTITGSINLDYLNSNSSQNLDSQQDKVLKKIMEKYNIGAIELQKNGDDKYDFEGTTNDGKYITGTVITDQILNETASSIQNNDIQDEQIINKLIN